MGICKNKTTEGVEQHDDHIWITVAGEAWAIFSIRRNRFLLWRGYSPNLEFMVMGVEHVDWESYCEKAHKKLMQENAGQSLEN